MCSRECRLLWQAREHLLGYNSNISHFSAAFRKQFGVLLRVARRGVLG